MVPSARHAAAVPGGTPLPVQARFARAHARACAERTADVTVQRFTIAGRVVETRIAGADLAALFARGLLPADDRSLPAELVVDLWDGTATAVPPPPAQDDEPYPARDESGERFMLAPGGRAGRFSSPDFEVHLDRDAARAVGWIGSANRLAYWHRARPLRTLLTPWMADRGCAVFHAATVARPGRALVLAAPSHHGKSTCAAACGAAGFHVLGDDTAAVEARGGAVVAHAVHTAVKLRRDGIERHGELAARVADAGFPWADDAVAYTGELFSGPLVATAPLAAVAFPELAGADRTTFARLGRAEALRRLTGCLLSVDPADLGTAFEHVAEILARVPAYRLAVGRDAGGIPAAVDDLLADTAA